MADGVFQPLPATGGALDADGWPLDAADFPGCEPVRIPRDSYEDYDGRVEYWDSRTETAMIVREVSRFHERPSQRLAALAERIAAASGTVIETFGTTDLVRFGSGGERRVLMQADQILYIAPAAAAVSTPRVDVDGGDLPEVVLEVDYSTDARRGKLPRYEAWGFPEVWVDVPDERSSGRPKSRLPGLAIHLLEGGSFRKSEESRAFPGWTADEIHRALNEPITSAGTFEVLHRVGRALGARHGTGPDDDPWLRTERDEGRSQGFVEGRNEGFVAAALALLDSRGIPYTHELATSLRPVARRSPKDLIAAAQACTDADDLLRLLQG